MNTNQEPGPDPEKPVLPEEDCGSAPNADAANQPGHEHEDALNSALDEMQSQPAGQSMEEASLRQQLQDAESRALRSQAELENYRKRTQRDLESQLRFANLPLLRDLLPVLDNLRRALGAADQSPTASGLQEGVQLVEQQFCRVLEKFACKPIPAEGELFDPNFHEAIGQVPSELAAGMVVQVAVEGYQVHDRVVRPAQVLISSGPPTSQD